jgi:hypothetical protein
MSMTSLPAASAGERQALCRKGALRAKTRRPRTCFSRASSRMSTGCRTWGFDPRRFRLRHGCSAGIASSPGVPYWLLAVGDGRIDEGGADEAA